MKHTTRKTIRTTFQVFVTLCALAPVLVAQTGLDTAKLPWLVTILAGAAVVTRLMNTPKVESFLSRFLPWLAAEAPPAAPGPPE